MQQTNVIAAVYAPVGKADDDIAIKKHFLRKGSNARNFFILEKIDRAVCKIIQHIRHAGKKTEPVVPIFKALKTYAVL